MVSLSRDGCPLRMRSFCSCDIRETEQSTPITLTRPLLGTGHLAPNHSYHLFPSSTSSFSSSILILRLLTSMAWIRVGNQVEMTFCVAVMVAPRPASNSRWAVARYFSAAKVTAFFSSTSWRRNGSDIEADEWINSAASPTESTS
jgi:hypothetical protein